MAGRSVSFNTNCNLCESHIEAVARWLSCNGEVWGVGPTAVFGSAAALFLFNELEAGIYVAGDHLHVSLLEKTLVSTMVLGMLALMIHLWVCSMRFFQYYLDTLIKDSPSVLLELTTAGLLGGQDMAALGPLTRFLRHQQPQIHITLCWLLALCYADYVRKHYCRRFNMPYLEHWQAEVQARVARHLRCATQRAHSLVGSLHNRLRHLSHDNRAEPHTARACLESRRWKCADRSAATACTRAAAKAEGAGEGRLPRGCSRAPAKPRSMLYRNSETLSRGVAACASVHRSPASLVLPLPQRDVADECPWRSMVVPTH